MKDRNRIFVSWLYGIAIAIFILGLTLSAWIFKNSNNFMYPEMISDAYRSERYYLNLPGSKVVNLTRIGAYGIYYETGLSSSPDQTIKPPGIKCSITALSSGRRINAVPDYVPSNNYFSKKKGRIGVLVMSISVDKADQYTFDCHYVDGSKEPQIVVTLGPNYFWEFFKSSRKNHRSFIMWHTDIVRVTINSNDSYHYCHSETTIR